jgi:fructose-bisphosphate aldolase, class I
VARKYAHKIPFIVKLNHNELLTYPNTYDQILFGNVSSRPSTWARRRRRHHLLRLRGVARQIRRSPRPSHEAHELGMFTVLWCYLRNPAFKTDGADYHVAADLTGQANHLGVTIEADIIKQKLPENNGGYNALN